MPVIQQQDPLSVAIDALAGFFGQKQQNQQYADQTNYQRQQDATANAMAQQEFALRQQQAATDKQLADQQTKEWNLAHSGRNYGLDPKKFTKMTPEQRESALYSAYTQAMRAGDTTSASSFLNAANNIGLTDYRSAETQYTLQGRLPLAQAQAAREKQLHSEVMAKLQNEMARAGATQSAAMARAQLAARTRLQAAGMSADARETIAAMTALNLASRGDFNQAFQTSLATYKAQESTWQKGYAAELKQNPGMTPDQYSQQTGNAQPTFNISMPSQQPTVVMVQLPNGNKVPVVTQRPVTPGSTRAPIAQEVKKLRAAGIKDSDPRARQALKADGYSDEEIDKAYGFKGGGFGKP